MVGVGFVLVRERADRTLKQPGDAADCLNVPELAVIPSSSADAAQYSNGGAQFQGQDTTEEACQNCRCGTRQR